MVEAIVAQQDNKQQEKSFKTTAQYIEVKQIVLFKYTDAIRQYELASNDLMLHDLSSDVISFFSKTLTLYLFLKPKLEELPDTQKLIYKPLASLEDYSKNPILLRHQVITVEGRLRVFKGFVKALNLLSNLIQYLGYTAVEKSRQDITTEIITEQFLLKRFKT